MEDSRDGDGNGETEDNNGEENTSPVEKALGTIARGFVGLDGLSGSPVEAVTDEVADVHDTGEFDDQGNVEGEGHEVGVDVVKHTVRGVTLGGELSDVDVGQNHSNTRSQEDGGKPVRKAKNFSPSDRGSTKTDGEVDEDNHELTSHEVTVEVVSLVSKRTDAVGDRVRILVQFAVNWWKTNHGALSSFNHRHP